ncbi:MAG: ornithine cyclodeaminase family protein, partial [Pseudomonadota bacterium]
LASSRLSRPESRSLLVIGTGRVARQLALAHAAVRPIDAVRIWGRNGNNASAAAAWVEAACGVACSPVASIEAAAAGADIISAATPSEHPLLRGAWVEPGTHIDLVGAYKPNMCETDSALISRANQVYVDTLEAALDEAGELIQAATAGVFSFDDVAGDLHRIAAAGGPLRRSADEVTVFKSVGSALEDLAAAQLCLKRRDDLTIESSAR